MEQKEKYAEKIIRLTLKKMDVNVKDYKMDELIKGMIVELEHGSENERTNLTNDDAHATLQIVLAHLNEDPNYYSKLEGIEKNKNLNESKRYRELIGVSENQNKKHLTNHFFQEENQRKTLKEEINKDEYEIEKIDNDGMGSSKDENTEELYKMKDKKDYLDLEEI